MMEVLSCPKEHKARKHCQNVLAKEKAMAIRPGALPGASAVRQNVALKTPGGTRIISRCGKWVNSPRGNPHVPTGFSDA